MPAQHRKKETAPADPAIYKILDANVNRAKEGLRVCEDILRFHLKSEKLTKSLRNIRHDVSRIMHSSSVDMRELIMNRKTEEDPGRNFANQTAKRSCKHLFLANMQRTKEALRVLEEFLKLKDSRASMRMQKVRFNVYDIEKKLLKAFPSLFDPR